MTPADLAAIRERDATSAWGPEDALQACLDRRALLAEGERLKAENKRLALDNQRLASDFVRVAVTNGELGKRLVDATGDLDREVARIRAAVLAAIDGEGE